MINERRAIMVVGYLVLSLPIIVWGAVQALKTNSNSPVDWVSERFAPRQSYDHFCDLFGPGDLLVSSWQTCKLADDTSDRILHELRTSALFHPPAGESLIGRVGSGKELFELARKTLGDNRARDYLGGIAFGPEGDHTSITLQFTAEGLRHRASTIAAVQHVIQQQTRLHASELHFAGPVMDGFAVDALGKQTLDQLALPAGIVMFLIAWVSLQSLLLAVLVFSLASLTQGATLATIHWTGHQMSALLITLPPLIQVLTIASSIHLCNYYKQFSVKHGATRALHGMLRNGWLPCLLSSGTTAIGLCSLMASEVEPVRLFGLFASIGVVLSFGAVLILLPIGLRWIPAANVQSNTQRWTPKETWIARIHRFRWPIVVSSLLLIFMGTFWISKLQSSVHLDTMFSRSSKIMTDYGWLEQHVGPLVPLDVVVSVPTDQQPTFNLQQQCQVMQDIESVLRTTEGVEHSFSVAPLLQQWSSGQPAVLQQLEPQIRLLSNIGYYFRGDQGKSYWRITAYLSALEPLHYGDIVHTIENRLTTERIAENSGAEIVVTGVMPLVYEIQVALLRDLLVSFLSALAMIYVIMSLVQGGLVAGAIAMIPNILPILVVFGLCGGIGQAMDIGSVMTGSIALGIAVDDTLHFLSFYQREIGRGKSNYDAVTIAFTECHRAMIQTTVCCAGGILIFALSDFGPTARFAWMLATLLTIALLADLIVLPALLLATRRGNNNAASPAARRDPSGVMRRLNQKRNRREPSGVLHRLH